MIRVSINNTPLELEKALSVRQLLTDQATHYAGDPASIAVAINGEFVPRSQYAERILQHRDSLDIVSPVGGG